MIEKEEDDEEETEEEEKGEGEEQQELSSGNIDLLPTAIHRQRTRSQARVPGRGQFVRWFRQNC